MPVTKGTRDAKETADVKDTKDAKYVKVTSPMGAETTVPVELVDVLVGSGYKKSK